MYKFTVALFYNIGQSNFYYLFHLKWYTDQLDTLVYIYGLQ